MEKTGMRTVPRRASSRFFRLLGAGLFAAVAVLSGAAQQITLRARSNLVLVPTLVESKSGEPVFNLGVQDFTVKDNGVPQTIHLDADTDQSPLSIVVLVQVGGSALREFHKMIGLPTMVEALAGNTRHRVAVVAFDSRPRMLLDFSSNPAAVRQAVYSIQPGDQGAAILDSVWYAVDMLQDEPKQNQRVIVLLSETRDHGSRTPIKNVVQKIGRSDVVVYSLAFSPSRGDLLDFSNVGGSADLLAPLRMAIAAMRKNAAAAIPHMTGGQYFRFNHGKQLDNQMAMLANQVHNRYILSFQPSNPAPGMHQLSVELNSSLDARVLARTNYWAVAPAAVEQDTMPEGAPGAPPPD
jgi:VWFA-related protein